MNSSAPDEPSLRVHSGYGGRGIIIFILISIAFWGWNNPSLLKYFPEKFSKYFAKEQPSDKNTHFNKSRGNHFRLQSIPSIFIRTLNTRKTYRQFRRSLRETRTAILIESPWLGKATERIIPDIERLVRQQKYVILLYGNSSNKTNGYFFKERLEAVLKDLESRFSPYFVLINLWKEYGESTHRKILIKDNEYYITGSYNFLSFDYEGLINRKSKVISREETILIRDREEAIQKWQQIRDDYQLQFLDNIIYRLKNNGTDNDFRSFKSATSPF